MGVEKMDADREQLAPVAHRRFVKVAPPTVHAGVGNALREAFPLNGEVRCMTRFEDLLSRID
jgi:hypothetical protein